MKKDFLFFILAFSGLLLLGSAFFWIFTIFMVSTIPEDIFEVM